MLRYDEAALVHGLGKISTRARAAFAAACAERMFPSYGLFGELSGREDPDALAGILERAWEALLVQKTDMSKTHADLAHCMSLIPGEDDEPYIDEQPYAENAASAVAYTLRAVESSNPQEAAWAARQAYEALDHHVMHRLGIEDEEQIMAHALLQAEFARQLRDLDQLRVADSKLIDAITEVRERAKAEAPSFFIE